MFEMRKMSLGSLFAAALLTVPATADVPNYSTFELQCRANFGVNPSGSFNLPPGSFFTSGTPDLNNNGEVVIRLISIDGDGDRKGLFFGSGGQGGIVWEGENGSLVSDASINNHGFVVMPQTFSSINGIYFYDDADGSSGFLTNNPLGTSTWTSPTVNDNGEVAYRINFSGAQGWYSYDGQGGGTFHVNETGNDPNSPYSFLFSPKINNNRQIAGKALLAAGGNQIILADVDGTVTVIASDTGADSSSPYTSFSNSVSVTNDGRVAFEAGLVGGGRGIYLSNGDSTVEIATTADPQITSFDFFTPVTNNNGLVVFRARDAENLSAIFVGDGTELRRVIGQFDEIPTDVGPGQIAQHDTSPVFGGSPAINDNGDIAFNAALTPIDDTQVEWGSGVYIAYADSKDITGDLNGDGVVDVADLLLLLAAWGTCPQPCPADLNGDGVVDVADMLILLANWG